MFVTSVALTDNKEEFQRLVCSENFACCHTDTEMEIKFAVWDTDTRAN